MRSPKFGVWARLSGLFAILGTFAPASETGGGWSFTDVTTQAGFNYTHGYTVGPTQDNLIISGGVAVGDYDRDGWVDLYATRGNIGPNLLYRNRGDGTFEEVGALAGVDALGLYVGPTFADYDGDGWLDLFVGATNGWRPLLYRNNGDGTFTDVAFTAGLWTSGQTWSMALGDYDRDGDLDLAQAHWITSVVTPANHLWRNNGDGTFTPVNAQAGITGYDQVDFTFTPNFADINNDGWPDLLMASDFSTTRYFINDQDGTFTDATTSVISDENGMGAAIADFDHDGDLDWFVTAIISSPAAAGDNPSLPGGGPGADTPGDQGLSLGRRSFSTDPELPPRTQAFTGNRFYCNQGNGTFTDCTNAAGVLYGHWGWAASFQDFNNDGDVDLFHVNGYYPQFASDPSVMFVSNGDGTFTEQATALGLDEPMSSRGLACFDYDRDGDIDIFIANNSDAPRFYRNDGGNDLNYLTVKLDGPPPNTEAIGARVYATVGSVTQMRELRAGNNYVSQDPAMAHFGLGNAILVDELRIVWPDGTQQVLNDVAPNQRLTINMSGPVSIPALRLAGWVALLSFFGMAFVLRLR